jgi:hypothetical protein
MKSKKDAPTTTHCNRTLTDKLIDTFSETSVHINLLNARGKNALSSEAVLGLTETFLSKRMPLFFLMWIRILRMLVEEVEVTIHYVDDGTGMVVLEPDNICLDGTNRENVVRYVKLPDPYTKREYYDASKVMFSVVGQDYDKVAASKVTRTHLGFFPIHGPWAEMFRPRMTQGVFTHGQSAGGGTWWHPTADLFQLEDFIPHIKASFNDMIILLFCGSDTESVVDAEKKERDFICSLPLYVKRCIELDLASIMTNASAAKYHPALVVPLLDNNDEDTIEDAMSKTPLVNGRVTIRYFTSPTYITFNIPYEREPQDIPPLDGSELPQLPLKQTPAAVYSEIEERVMQLHKAFVHVKMASALTADESMILPVVIKFDGTTTYRGIPSRLFVLFSQYFGRDEITQKKKQIGGCGEDNISNLKRKAPTHYDSEIYNSYIYGKRRQIVTGVYHSKPFPAAALHSPPLTPRLSPTRCSEVSYPIKTDSLPHDALTDYFSYLFMLYLSPDPTSTSLFLSQLILYRIQEQMDIWSGQSNDGTTIGARDIPDVASIARFRAHQLLTNGLFVRYASIYWTNFTKRPINSTVSGNLSSNGTDTPIVSGTLADIYTGSFIEILKEYEFFHNNTQDVQIFLTKYKTKCDAIKEIFMSKNHYKVPLCCVTMNFNFFLTTAVRHFTEAKMVNLIKSLSNTEKTYYDDRNEELMESYFPLAQIHSMASKIAQRLESYEFNAHKRQADMGVLE